MSPNRSHVARKSSPVTWFLAPLLLAACQSSTAHDVASSTVGPASAASSGHERASTSEAAVTARILELAKSDNRVEAHLEEMLRQFGPRLTSSSNLTRAVEWTRDQFAAWGLDARLESWGEFPVGFERGRSQGAIVAPVQEPLEFATDAWTAGTQLPRRGPVIVWPKTQEALAALGDAISGAWILVPNFPRGERPDLKLRRQIDAALEEHGAAGWIQRAFGRGDLLLTGGNWDIRWEELPTRVTVRLRADQFDALVARLEGGEPVEVEFSVENRFVQGPITQYNVVADIVGSEKPDEYVIVGGHIDSWDGAQGAQDNGTGVATTMEAARLLAAAGAAPKRTIRFVLFGGEEQGLYGSRGYVRDHEGELEHISAVFVHDGGTNYVSGIRATPEMEADLRESFLPAIGLDADMPFELDIGEGLPNSGDSDHAPFISKGVPGFFWEQDGKSDYNRVHHTQYDTLDTVVPEYQRHSAVVIALGAYRLANRDNLLSRANMESIQPRRMGVQLDGNKITEVMGRGAATRAGLEVGDVVLAIDGAPVENRQDISSALQKGGPKKVFKIRRGEQELEIELDWSQDDSEVKREERAKLRAEREAEKP